MFELLTALGERLKREKDMRFATLAALTEYAALTMAGEVGSWHAIYRAGRWPCQLDVTAESRLLPPRGGWHT